MNRPTASNRLASLELLYGRTLRICDELEEVADTLPNPDRRLCRRLAVDLVESVSVVTRREEHAQDRSAATAIARALINLARGRAVGSHEAIGYMLRAYFLGVRRHVAFELTLLASVKATAGRN